MKDIKLKHIIEEVIKFYLEKNCTKEIQDIFNKIKAENIKGCAAILKEYGIGMQEATLYISSIVFIPFSNVLLSIKQLSKPKILAISSANVF